MDARVDVVQLGSRMHYAVPRILNDAGMLGLLFTDAYIGNKPALERLLRSIPGRLAPRGLRGLLGRREPALPPERVVSFDLLGLYLWFKQASARNSSELAHVYARGNKAFNSAVIRRGLSGARAVWGFNGASLEIFEHARAHGARCILEQTIAPRRIEAGLLSREAARWPGWQPGLEELREDDELGAREQREWSLADVIVAGSEFVVDGLVACGVPVERCRVVPYGVAIPGAALVHESEPRREGRVLRVAFAGEVGLRKGIPYLLEALAGLGPVRVEARIAGRVAINPERLKAYRPVATFLGAIPRSEMAALYAWADVFCLPSICEGSATVIYEALAHGLPVITTPNSGSVVRDGVEGRVVPASDAEALRRVLAVYCEDRNLLAEHRRAALDSREKVGIRRYSEDLLSVIREVLS